MHLDPDHLSRQAGLRRLARRLVLDEPSADDLVQEAYLVALEAPEERIEDPRAWLAVVARRLAGRERRRAARRWRRESQVARPEGAGVRCEVELRDTAGSVQRLIAELEEPYRSVIRLRFLDGLALEEIAERVARPVGTIKSQVHRGLRRLREELDRRHAGERSAWVSALLPFALGRPPAAAAPPGLGSARHLRTVQPLYAGSFLLLVTCLTVAVPLLLGRGEPEAAPSTERVAGVSDDAQRPSSPVNSVNPVKSDARDVGRSALSEAQPATGSWPRPATGLRVSVVDGAGRPVGDACVECPRASAPARVLGTTDDAGTLWIAEPGDLPRSPLSSIDGRARVALSAVATGQGPSEVVHVPLSPTGTARAVHLVLGAPAAPVFGRVVDSFGDPVEGALVRRSRRPECRRALEDGYLITDREGVVRTDRDGAFALEHLDPGSFRLAATADGFADARVPVQERAAAIEVVLEPGAILRGRVVDPAGHPRSGARVWLAPPIGVMQAERETRTGQDGSWEIEGIPAGPVVLWALDEQSPTPRVGYLQLDVQPRAQLARNLIVSEHPALRIAVVDERGSALPGALVFLKPESVEFPWRRFATADERGIVTLYDVPRLAIQAHVLRNAEELGYPQGSLHGARADDRTRELVLQGSGYGRVRATLLDAQGRLLTDAYAHVTSDLSGVTRGFPFDPGTGALEMPPIAAGPYRLYAWRPGFGLQFLASFELEADAVLDLGALRLSAPAQLNIDWRWGKDSEPERVHFRIVAVSPDGQRRLEESIDEGHREPRASYALFPGEYRLEVRLHGETVHELEVRLAAGEEAQLRSGSDGVLFSPGVARSRTTESTELTGR